MNNKMKIHKVFVILSALICTFYLIFILGIVATSCITNVNAIVSIMNCTQDIKWFLGIMLVGLVFSPVFMIIVFMILKISRKKED